MIRSILDSTCWLTMTKTELRKVYVARRKALGEGEEFQLSRQICDLFFASTDLSLIKILHCYLPIENKREPDTWLIMDRIRREFPHIRLVIPKVTGNEIENFFFEGLHQLEKNKWGIPEPRQGVPADPQKIDAVVVPLLAYDTNGHRVGYGKGYYDRFLSQCQPSCARIGLSFFEPESHIDDVSPYDIALTRCITPSGVVDF